MYKVQYRYLIFPQTLMYSDVFLLAVKMHASLSHFFFSLPIQEEVVLDILGLAQQYGFVDLEVSISDYLQEILQIRNVCIIFDAARLYQLQFLTQVCSSFMDQHALDIIHHETFLQLSAVRKSQPNRTSVSINVINHRN